MAASSAESTSDKPAASVADSSESPTASSESGVAEKSIADAVKDAPLPTPSAGEDAGVAVNPVATAADEKSTAAAAAPADADAAAPAAPSDEKSTAPAAPADEKSTAATAPADVDGNAAAVATPAALPETSTKPPPKKQWGDDDFGEGLDLDALRLSSDAGDVDKPEIALKSETLNEEAEAPETEIRKVLADNTPYTSAKSFEDLNLPGELLKGIYTEMKFEKPSRIQAETLPLILTPPFRDLIAQAHNGSGKTVSFVLGMLSRVDPNIHTPQALCVCPTRELVIQNEQVLTKMAKHTKITAASTAAADRASVSSSRRDPIVDQVVIGTPGTLKRWMTKDRILTIRNINVLVFDEADHMLDQGGFQDDSLRIIKAIKSARPTLQILLFSATFSEKVKAFTTKVVPGANQIFVEKEQLSLDVIRQYRVRCPNEYAKMSVIKDRIFPAAERLGQSIIFVRTRHSASELHKTLANDGYKCTSIQGGLSHEERDKVIEEFRRGTTKILISTDVLARGFDQAQVTLVVNYDIPVKSDQPGVPDYELYLHRIGRSGRFGRKGAAFNLTVGGRDDQIMELIGNHFRRGINEVQWDDDDSFERVLKEAGLA